MVFRLLPEIMKLSLSMVALLAIILPMGMAGQAASARDITIGVLMANDLRQEPLGGLQKGLLSHEEEENITFSFHIKNAKGNRAILPQLAAELVALKPELIISTGGIESDALLVATAASHIPVVFLSVSSSVDRGIVASLTSSKNNFTGIDTNDSQLTAKRLWFIHKILPEAKTILCYHVPSIVPSGEALDVAQKTAAELGLIIKVFNVESERDIEKATENLSGSDVDVILQLPAAPIDRALKDVILPSAMAEKIPIFGYGRGSINSGAFASYAGSRYANGRQAARLVHKIIHGVAPADIPVETPENLELILNRAMVKKLGLSLSSRVWKMADEIVDLDF